MSDVDAEFARLLPKLRKIERAVREAGLTSNNQAALMTMLAARLMGTAGAMMAAHADAAAGRQFDNSDTAVAEWTEAVAKHVVGLVRSGAVN